MIQEDDFYLNLDSGCPRTLEIQKNNKIGNFVTRLPEKYILQGEWEVSLSKIQYSKTWLNIPEDQNLYLAGNIKIYRVEEKFPAGSYSNIEEIISVLNDIYARFVFHFSNEFILPPVIEYVSHMNKLKVTLGIGHESKGFVSINKYLYPVMSEYLAQYLGLMDNNGNQMPHFENLQILYKTNHIKPEYNVHNDQSNMIKYPTIITPLDLPKVFDNIMKTKPDWSNVEQTFNKNNSNRNKSEFLKSSDNDYQKDNSNDEDGIIKIDSKKQTIPLYINDQPSNSLDNFKSAFVYGYKQVQLHGFMKNINVYCDVIRPVVIGGVAAPLLRTIPLYSGDAFGDHVEYEPNTREYNPVLYKEFDHIEVDLKNDQNETIAFKTGKVYITLHFRKKVKNV